MATAMIMLIVSALTLVVANLLDKPIGATRIDGTRKAGRLCGKLRERRRTEPEGACDAPDFAEMPLDEDVRGR